TPPTASQNVCRRRTLVSTRTSFCWLAVCERASAAAWSRSSTDDSRNRAAGPVVVELARPLPDDGRAAKDHGRTNVKRSKGPSKADLLRRIAELEAQHARTCHFATQTLDKAGDAMMASAVIVRLTALGGREIIPAVAI